MTNFKQRIYESYRTTTDRNPYRMTAVPRGNEYAQYEARWARFLPTDKQAPILDVACGDGMFLLYLQNKGYTNLHGVDISLEQVQAAHRAGLDLVQQGDALFTLRQQPANYAAISTLSFLEHLSRDDLFVHLDAIRAALRPGGLFFGLVPNAKGPFGSHVRYADITHDLSFTPESILQVAAVIDMEPVYIGECGPVPHGLVSSLRWAIWQGVRGLYWLMRVAQAADYRYRVYSQDLRFVLRRPL